MEKEPKTVPFKLQNIVTEQFATIKSAYQEGEKIRLSSSVGFSINPSEKSVAVNTQFEFDQEKRVFLLIEVACHFAIESKAWQQMLSDDGTQLNVPQGLALHLAVITVGTTRGVLHAKTEKTMFNQFILPTVNLSEIIKENPVLDLKHEQP